MPLTGSPFGSSTRPVMRFTSAGSTVGKAFYREFIHHPNPNPAIDALVVQHVDPFPAGREPKRLQARALRHDAADREKRAGLCAQVDVLNDRVDVNRPAGGDHGRAGVGWEAGGGGSWDRSWDGQGGLRGERARDDGGELVVPGKGGGGRAGRAQQEQDHEGDQGLFFHPVYLSGGLYQR